jgi:signal transduction histidine kinase
MRASAGAMPKSALALLFFGFLSCSSSFAFPLLATILITRTGLSAAGVGWLVCAAFLGSAVLQPRIGALLDRGEDGLVLGLAAAGVLVGIYGIYAGARVAALLAPALMIFVTAFSTVTTAASRILEGTATDESRGRMSILFMAAANGGFGVSSIAAYFLLQTHQSALLALDAATTLIYIGALYSFRPAAPAVRAPSGGGAAAGTAERKSGPMRVVLAGSFLLFMSVSACLSAIPLLYSKLGFFGNQMLPVMFGTSNVVVAVLGIGFASAINEVPLLWQILISSLLFAIGQALLPWVDTQLKNVLATAVWSVGEIFAYPITARLIFACYKPSEAGKAAGIKSSLLRLSMAATPALSALLVGNPSPWAFSAVLGSIPLAAGALLLSAAPRIMKEPALEQPQARRSLQSWIQSRFQRSILVFLSIALALIFSANSFLMIREKINQLLDANQAFISSQLPNLQVYDFTKMNSDLEVFAQNKPLSAARMIDANGVVIGQWSSSAADDDSKSGMAIELSRTARRSIDYRYDGGDGQLVIREEERDLTGAALGTLEERVPCFLFLKNMLLSALAFLVVMGLTYFFGLRLARVSAKTASGPLEAVSKSLQAAVSPEDLAGLEIATEVAEIDQLIRRFRSLGQRLQDEERSRIEAEKSEAIALIASQVAHDIRSPLAALDSVIRDLSQLPEDKRILIRSAAGRIRDIANSLLDRQRAPASGTAEAASPQLLSSLIESLATEKRLQYRSRSRVEIEAWLDASSYGIFARLQPVEFKRVLSNLINNAMEAFGEGPGSVRVNLSARGGRALVSVQDDGKGIPPEVLAKLGRRGETHGKTGGSGLGLYHARTSAESWGGSLEITAEVGKGTTTTVDLPQAPTPDWFVSELALAPGRAVVVLDDDASIHQVWQGRFDSIRTREHEIEIVHVSAPGEIRSWVHANGGKAREALYLLDYELLGAPETGLSLAEELAIGERSVLVTSRYEEVRVLEGCRKLKARLIPKGLAGLVPIRVEGRAAPGRERWDAVLIDDDPLVRMTWKIAAERAGKKLRAFSTAADFLKESHGIDRGSPVFVDAELGDGVKGHLESLKIHELGFGEIYLATGHSPERLAGLAHLRGVIGKTPPWTAEG